MRRVTVQAWEQVVRYARGRLVGVLGPGRYWIVGSARLIFIDTREQTLVMPLQDLVTADGLSVRISLAARWKVVDPVAFVTAAQDPTQSLYVQLQLALRAPVASAALADLVADRDSITSSVGAAVAPTARDLGIEVINVAVRDLTFPAELRTAFAEVLRARQEALAAIERARGEQAVLRSLANTADVLRKHPELLRLRALQVAQERGAQVVLHEVIPVTSSGAGS